MSKLVPSVSALLLSTMPALACPLFELQATSDLSHPLALPYFHQGTRVRLDFKGQVLIEIDEQDRSLITLPDGKVIKESPRASPIEIVPVPPGTLRRAIAPGTVVATFANKPTPEDWFVVGAHAILTAPAGGGYLKVAVYDSDGHDNSGTYQGVIMFPDPVDWNADAAIDARDLMAFINDYMAGEADFNRDTVTDTRDFFAFLEDYLNQVAPEPPPPDADEVDPDVID